MSAATEGTVPVERICPHCQYKDFYPDPMPVGTRCTSCSKAMATLVQKSPVQMAERGVHLSSMDELFRFADMVAKSHAYPRWRDPVAISVAIQTGLELGFTPVTALRSLYVAKDGGRPELYGQAALAKIRASSSVHWVDVGTSKDDWDSDEHYGYCRLSRRGIEGGSVEVKFTVAEAKRAGLWGGRGGAWSNYSDDMLVWKAVARCAKRYCSDILMGMDIRESQDSYIKAVRIDDDGRVIEPRELRERSDKVDPLFAGIDKEQAIGEAIQAEQGEGSDTAPSSRADEPDGDGVVG
jgi:bacterioferritin-associated ferredoxin